MPGCWLWTGWLGGMAGGLGQSVWAQHSVMGMRHGHETGAWTLLMDDGGWQEGGAAGDVWE